MERRDEFEGLSCDFEGGRREWCFCEAKCGLSGVGERERGTVGIVLGMVGTEDLAFFCFLK